MTVGVTVTGVPELQKRFRKLEAKVQTKLVKAAVTAGGRVVVKAIKRNIPSNLKDGRKAIGFRFSKGKGAHSGKTFAKAGVGVGLKKSKKAGKSRTGRPGVGVGASNLHWFIMGTEERSTGSKRVGAHRRGVVNRRVLTGKTVRRTGRLKKEEIVKMAVSQSKTAAEQAIENNIMAGINREWSKR